MTNLLGRRELYHNTPLAENVTFTPDWQEIDIRGLAKVERDRQMVGFTLKEPYWIDFDLGELKSGTGEIVRLEVRIVTDEGKIYPTYFGNARGKTLASYRPEAILQPGETLEKLQFRSDDPFEAEHVIWTTYNFKDMK
ncbi:MAG: hypothetical protein ABL984_21555 [Pyrinomonadaceae bacterium]